MSYLQLITALAVVIFLVVVTVRTVKITRTPLSLRWELMPIPHEKGRYYYGGSQYEELDWWKNPPHGSLLTELKAMLAEIFFIKSLYEKNRQLWWFSYPFHTGLYLLGAYLVLLAGGSISELTGIPVSPAGGIVGSTVYAMTVVCGAAGLVLGIIGAGGLLYKRTVRRELRFYSAPSDYFNLVLLLAVLVTGFSLWLGGDTVFAEARAFVSSTFSLSPAKASSPLMVIHVILADILLIYLPFTHMIHFMAKYFAYHSIRWADAPNISGSAVEKKVVKQLGYKVSWSAPHVKRGGTWADAAAETVTNKCDNEDEDTENS